MLSKQFPIPLEKGMTKGSVITIFLGAMFIVLAGWKIVGWVFIAYGILLLFLAYHLGNAPLVDDEETGILIRDASDPCAVPRAGTEKKSPEWLGDHEVQNLAN
jgi:hypothetical protein